jgi:uncharacterized protein
MDVTPLIREGAQVIQSYSGGKFRVSGKVYEGAIIVTPDKTIAWDGPQNISELMPQHLLPLTRPRDARTPSPQWGEGRDAVGIEGEGAFDVILLGTGKIMKILPPVLRKELKAIGLAVESMDSGAACRTYNVLMAEGRRVAAALLPVF